MFMRDLIERFRRWDNPSLYCPDASFRADIERFFNPINKSVSRWLKFYDLSNIYNKKSMSGDHTTAGERFKSKLQVQSDKTHHNVPYTSMTLGLSFKLFQTTVFFINQKYNKTDLSELNGMIVFYDPNDPAACLTSKLKKEIEKDIKHRLSEIETINEFSIGKNDNRSSDLIPLLNRFIADPDLNPEDYFSRKQLLPPRPKMQTNDNSSARLEATPLDIDVVKKVIESEMEALKKSPDINLLAQFGFGVKNQILQTEKAVTEWQGKKLKIPPSFTMYRSMTASFKHLLEHTLAPDELAEQLSLYCGDIGVILQQLPKDMSGLSESITDTRTAQEIYDTNYEISDLLCETFNKASEGLKAYETRPGIKTISPSSIDVIAQELQLTRLVRNQNKAGFDMDSVPHMEAITLNIRQIHQGLDQILSMMNKAQRASAEENMEEAQKLIGKITHKMEGYDSIIEEHETQIKSIEDGTHTPLQLTHEARAINGDTIVVATLKPAAKVPR